MRKSGILNVAILSAIASIGHTQTLVIADPGLPIPPRVPCIDIALLPGIPAFLDVLKAVRDEMALESFTLASELKELNPAHYRAVCRVLAPLPHGLVSHTDFKKRTEDAYTIIRTGDTLPYSNIILRAGVSF